MKKYTLLFLCFVVIQSYAQTTRYVKADATGANNGTSWANAYTNFQTAVSAASSGDEVWVAAGTYQPASGQFFAMKEGVKIYGGFAGTEGTLIARNWTTNVTTLQGNGSYVIKNELNGLTNAAVLDGFTVTGGSAVLAGAGMYNASSWPSVVNCTFSGNTATYGAGAIYNYQCSAPPMITNCVFSNNSGATYGGAIYNVVSSPIITGCTFNNNTALAGGGIYSGNQSVPNISNCTFKNNTGTNAGGAIYYNGSGITDNAYISNCLFTGNISNAGSAIGYGDQVANNMIITNCTFYNNTGSAAIYARFWNAGFRPIILNNSIVYSNTSFFDRTASGGEIQVNYSLLQGASCPVGGTCNTGVIYNQDPKFVDATAGNFKLQQISPAVNKGNNSLYVGLNSATLDLASGLRLLGATIDIGAFESPYNPVPVPDAMGVVYIKQNGAGDLSGNSWANAAPELSNALTAAVANTNIQQIWVAKGTYQPASGQSFVMKEGVKMYGGFAGTESQINQRVFGTTAADSTLLQGNGSYVVSSVNLSAASIIDGFSIKGGSGQTWGGGMYNYGSAVTINNCLFAANSATIGGGICNYYSSAPTISNCIFSENTADGGGGISNYNNSSPTISNCTFFRNRANSGGAINNYSSSKPNITGCTFTENTANDFGGAITNSTSSSSTITNCNFSGNKATSASGGAIFNTASSPVITDCSFSSNTSSTYGGGIFNEQSSTANISNSTFTSNASGGGGGIFNTGSSPNIVGCTFTSNSASVSGGGGVFNYSSSSAIISNCTFVGNTVSAYGGGGMMNNAASPTVTNCVFKGNTTTGNGSGGGMYNISGATTVKNCVFYGNTTLRYGGAIYNGGASPKLINCTISG